MTTFVDDHERQMTEQSVARLLAFLDGELAGLPASSPLADIYRGLRTSLRTSWPQRPGTGVA